MRKRDVMLFLAVLSVFSFFIECIGYWPMGHMNGYGMYGMGGGLFMGIIGLVFLLLIVLGLYYFVKNKGFQPGSNETPLDILKKRYAGGEITREEFERMKEELK